MTTPTTPDMCAPDSIAELRARLAEAEDALRAIRSGEVDAITVSMPDGERVYSLKGAEQPYRDMIEAMSEGAVVITPEGLVVYCNQYFARLTGTDPNTIMGSKLLAYFADQDRARVTKAHQGHPRRHQPNPCAPADRGRCAGAGECRHARSDGWGHPQHHHGHQ